MQHENNKEHYSREILEIFYDYWKHENWTEIIALSEKVIAHHKDNPEVYFISAFAYYAGQADYAKAEQFSQGGLAIETNNSLLHIYIVVLLKQEKFKKAIDVFRTRRSFFETYGPFADFIINNLIYCYIKEELNQSAFDELEPYFDDLRARQKKNFYYNAACLYAQADKFEETVNYILQAKIEGHATELFLESDDFARYSENKVFSCIVALDYTKKLSLYEYRVRGNEYREIKLLNFLPGYKKYKITDNSGSLDDYGKNDNIEEYTDDYKALIAYAQKREQMSGFGIETLSPHEQSWVSGLEKLLTDYQNDNHKTLPSGLVISWEPNLGICYASFKKYDDPEKAIERFTSYNHDVYDYELNQKLIECPLSLVKIAQEFMQAPAFMNAKKESVFYIAHQQNEFDFDFAIAIEDSLVKSL